jgi:hypothetical protein
VKSVFDKGFKYTPVSQQGHDYLRKKFKAIYDARAAESEFAAPSVSQIKPKVRAKT